MRKYLFVILISLFGPAAHTQVVTNLPGAMTGIAIFDKIRLTTPKGQFYENKLYGRLTSSTASEFIAGDLTCIGENNLNYLTATVSIGSETKLGNFQFDNQEVCVRVGNAIAKNPGKKVTFKVNLDRQGSMDGRIVSVAW